MRTRFIRFSPACSETVLIIPRLLLHWSSKQVDTGNKPDPTSSPMSLLVPPWRDLCNKVITNSGSRRVFSGCGIWPKYSAWFEKTLAGYGIWQNKVRDVRKRWRNMLVDCYPASGISQNLGRNAGCRWLKFGMRDSREKGAVLGDQEPLSRPRTLAWSYRSHQVFCCHQRHDFIWGRLWYVHSSNLRNPLQMIHYSCVHSILVWHTTPCLTKRRHPSKIPSFFCSLAHQRSYEESVSRVLL